MNWETLLLSAVNFNSASARSSKHFGCASQRTMTGSISPMNCWAICVLVGVIGNRLRCFLTERSTRLGLSTHPAIWSAYYERGKLKLAKVQLQEAFTDFGNALDCVRRWRAEVLPADAFRISSEVELQQVYSLYIEAGSLYELTRRKPFAEETLVVAEESPAAS